MSNQLLYAILVAKLRGIQAFAAGIPAKRPFARFIALDDWRNHMKMSRSSA
jgi:hypothetical protein